ncbi:AMP-dependent synthetase/ligase [Nocardioides montaniterrae]
MREYSTPPTVAVADTGNLTDDVVVNAAEAPEAVVFRRTTADGWVDVTAAAFHDEVRAVAKGLIAAGVGAGDRVALMSRTRYEWTLLDYAIWFAGAITVPIYESSSAEQIEWIVSDSGAVAMVVEDEAMAARLDGVRASRPGLAHVWSFADAAVTVLSGLGAGISDDEVEDRRAVALPSDVATLIYTSGTTGRPKGCRVTHGNLMCEIGVAVSSLEALFEGSGARTVLFLPLAHVFARIIQIGCVRTRTTLAHTSDIKNLLATFRELEPTFILAVPRIFEKVFNTASQQAAADGKGRAFNRAVKVAIDHSRALEAGRVPLRLRGEHAVFERLVYSRLREALGGSCAFAISGGAPLGDRLGHFYRGAGVTVLEGYGLTETTGALTVNLPDAQKVGTVGRPLPGTGVRVTDDGELAFRGGQVFAGYWNNAAATAEAVGDGGWFHTGDVGEVDDEGFVRITGRKKEILVTAGGKNVAPAVLEDRVRAHPLVSQCLVVGDGQPFIAALVTLDAEALPAWASARGKSSAAADLVDDADLLAEIQSAVDDANLAVSKAESIRKFTVLPSDWTEDAGQVTPSLKLKRNVVMRQCRVEIADLYA